MSKYKLPLEIIKLSTSETWEEAKKEWKLYNVYKEDEADRCLCGHPINEICEIQNLRNSNIAIVGNCCVKKFLKLESDKIFTSLRKINESIEKSISLKTLEYAHKKDWISDKEFDFYKDIRLQRKPLSPNQLSWKIDINNKIKTRISNARKKIE